MSDSKTTLSDLHIEILNYHAIASDLVEDICNCDIVMQTLSESHAALRKMGLALRKRYGQIATSHSSSIVQQCEFLEFTSRTVLVPIGLAVKNHSDRTTLLKNSCKYSEKQIEDIVLDDAQGKISRLSLTLKGWQADCDFVLNGAKKEARPFMFASIGTVKASRAKPDSAVTKWVRKNWHKFNYKKSEAVRGYIANQGESELLYDSLYAQLNNDCRKKPLKKPKKSQ
jgi:hypothetical protein